MDSGFFVSGFLLMYLYPFFVSNAAMHYAAIHTIRDIQSFKSNGSNLDPNLKISIQSGKKLHKYCEQNDSLEYLSKMSYLLPKNLLWVSGNPFCTQLNQPVLRKKAPNNFFTPGPQHDENGF